MVVTLLKSSGTDKKTMDHPSLLVQLFDVEARIKQKVQKATVYIGVGCMS
jgi:hypothetical protein